MTKRTFTAGLAALAILSPAAAAADAGGWRLVPTHEKATSRSLRITAGSVRSGCFGRIPAVAMVVTDVHANGTDLHGWSVSPLTQYYGGSGTLVQLRMTRRAGPVCFTATTWLPSARLRVSYHILGMAH